MNKVLNSEKFYKYAIVFFLAAFLGFLWEVLLHIFAYGELVNRGFCYGPLLPIYGYGTLLIAYVSKKVGKNPVKLFFITSLICGLLEYTTSVVLEVVFKNKWWDYSDWPLDINGRVCVYVLIAFGVLSVVYVYLIDPLIEKIVKKSNKKILKIVCTTLILLFIIDSVYSLIKPNISYGVLNKQEIINK